MKENRGVEATLRITTRDLGGGEKMLFTKFPPYTAERSSVFLLAEISAA
jgi:hypothetical protein